MTNVNNNIRTFFFEQCNLNVVSQWLVWGLSQTLKMGGKNDGTKTAFNMFFFSMDKSSNFSAAIKWLIRLGKIDGNTERSEFMPSLPRNGLAPLDRLFVLRNRRFPRQLHGAVSAEVSRPTLPEPFDGWKTFLQWFWQLFTKWGCPGCNIFQTWQIILFDQRTLG